MLRQYLQSNSLYQQLIEGKINENCPRCGSNKIGVVYDSDLDKEELYCEKCKFEFSSTQE